MRLITLLLIGVLALVAQQRPELNDGFAHGDAPYLIEEGWTPLLNGKDLSGWHAERPGTENQWFTTRGVRWEPFLGPTRLAGIPEPAGTMLNGPTGRTANLVTDGKYGDAELYVEFLLAKGSNSGVYLMGRYEVQVYDSFGVARDKYPGIECGGIYPRWTQARGEFEGHSPRVNATRPPGEWQSFDIVFHAPRFDPSGRKAANARFVSVKHNGQLIHENIELTGPTRAAVWEDEKDEKPAGPLMLQGDHGPVAYRNLQLRPLPAPR